MHAGESLACLFTLQKFSTVAPRETYSKHQTKETFLKIHDMIVNLSFDHWHAAKPTSLCRVIDASYPFRIRRPSGGSPPL